MDFYQFNRSIKHIIHVIAFLIHVVLFLKLTGFFENIDRFQDPFEIYGSSLAIILYFLKLLTFTGLPISLLNAVGILILDVFPKPARVARRSAPLLDPFISIRVVTRGSYPDLIRRNVERNLSICEEFGLDKFLIEIVTDREIGGLPRSAKLREIVVPGDYSTLSGTKFKARALQYALEPHVNILNDDDWIVHLDEETLLTNSALVGITNFLIEKKHQIGQGLITYGKEEVVNWMTTLADSIRVASDLGSLRFSLKTFHKPLYSFKGSFIVCQAQVERLVSFDKGIQGSIAEDSYFAIKAVQQGYSFDWVEGEMVEKSPFSLWDFVKQRKRWVQGLYLLVNDPSLKMNFSKLGFTYSFYNWIFFPVQFLISLVIMLNPISFSWIDELLSRLNGIIFTYMFLLGALKSFSFKRRNSLVKVIACFIGVFVSIPFAMVCETIAIVWGLLSEKKEFFIVTKNQDFIQV